MLARRKEMSRSGMIVLICTSMLLFLAAKPQNDRFSKYKAVEGYEVRPGILMMPRYAEDGQVCEIGLERRHYAPEMIRLDSSISREEIDGIVDELVPVEERGPKTGVLGGRDSITIIGPGMTTSVNYENISIQIESRVISSRKRSMSVDYGIAAIIQWKNRKCK
jgi:hypothetical protein